MKAIRDGDIKIWGHIKKPIKGKERVLKIIYDIFNFNDNNWN